MEGRENQTEKVASLADYNRDSLTAAISLIAAELEKIRPELEKLPPRSGAPEKFNNILFYFGKVNELAANESISLGELRIQAGQGIRLAQVNFFNLETILNREYRAEALNDSLKKIRSLFEHAKIMAPG